MLMLSRRIGVWSLSAVCALSAAALGAENSTISATGGGISATTDGTSEGTRIRINPRQEDEIRDASRAGRSRNAQLLRSRVEVLQKVGALRRWQASRPRSEREQAAIQRNNERIRKLQLEQIKRVREQQRKQRENQ